MSDPLLIALPVTAFVVACGVAARFRRYALSRGRFLDVPNARSSHVVATPRGGGVAIVIASLAVLPILGWIDALRWSAVWGLSGGGALVALIGIWDDAADVHPGWRLIGHFAAAAWTLGWLGGVPPLVLFGVVQELGWQGNVAAAVFVVWLLNLTNFMDGIDAIVAVEIISVCVGGALLYLLVPGGTTYWVAPLVLASATLGFLVWNWPPAKIFMGDTGSGFLGLTVATFSLQAASVEPALFWSWLILLGVFVVDADVTLLRRLARRERLYEAHRSHAYQHAARVFGGHRPVTLAVAAINVVWLFPFAAAVALGRLDGRLGVLIAYLPLVGLAVWLRAGIDNRQALSPPGTQRK